MKSVNLKQDFTRPEVLSLYNPTKQSLEIVRRIIGLRGSVANHVVAPYGSGKSFSALVGKTLLSDKHQLKSVLLKRINSVSKGLNGFVDQSQPNLVITLSGYCQNLPFLLCKEARIPQHDDIDEILINLQKKYKNYNHISIIWDEFGHHLETLVRERRQEDLLNVQIIAEWAVRRSKPTVTFTTLMHKNLGFYVRGTSQTISNTWKKIEGRFETIRLETGEIDSYEMIADTLQTKSYKSYKKTARKVQEAGLFKSLDLETIDYFLGRTVPLTPAALESLPRLGARFAQNERTLYQFLQEKIIVPKRNDPVGLDVLYDYFAHSLAGDVGPGGAYRKFVESETSLSQTSNLVQQQVIKATALLKLGNLSERINLSKLKLKSALVEGSNLSGHEVSKAIESLITKKLLFYRQHTDDVSIWYGTDYDLDSAIAEEVNKIAPEIDLAEGLERLIPPDPYFATKYNFQKSITRYALTRYVTISQLADKDWVKEFEKIHKHEDTVVLLVIDCTIKTFAKGGIKIPSHWILALPHQEIDFIPTFMELIAILKLQERKDLNEHDHLLTQELSLLQAAAEAALRNKFELVLNPDRGKVSWYYDGDLHILTGQTTSDQILTNLFEKRFSKAPIIRNEQVVRRKVSSVTKSARKRCNLAVFERNGTAHLGYEGSTSSDASVYRTVFEKTGLYFQDSDGWRWADPKDIKDANLKLVWSELQNFFSNPSKKPKSFEDILQKFLNPPFGIRAGLFPLLISSGIQAFGRGIAIHEILNGKLRYLEDIQPSLIEEICNEPENYTLTVFPFTPIQMSNLRRLVKLFISAEDPREKDLIRAFYDGIIAWRLKLPPNAQEAQGLGEEGIILQNLLFDPNFDPLAFLVQYYPTAIGGRPLTKRAIKKFNTGKKEIEGIIDLYYNQAIKEATTTFNSRNPGTNRPLLEAAEIWSRSIPQTTIIENSWDYIAKGVHNRSKDATNFPNGEKGYISMLSVILLGTSPEEWSNSDLQSFKDKLLEVLNTIELSILSSGEETAELYPFIKSRIITVIDQFSKKIGRAKVKQLIHEIYEERSN